MQIRRLHKEYDRLQQIHGHPTLDAVYGSGCVHNPDVCFVFMNPTAKNVSTAKSWRGLKAPWVGTKNTWKFFTKIGLFDPALCDQIIFMKPADWDYDFTNKVYEHIAAKKIFITNLSKATQLDARHLKNSEFKEYLSLLKEEIKMIKPKIIVAYGGQVASILLGTPIKISKVRKTSLDLKISEDQFKVFPVYYPVGQGMRNIGKSLEDTLWILKTQQSPLTPSPKFEVRL